MTIAIPVPTPALKIKTISNVGAKNNPAAAKLVEASPMIKKSLALKRTLKTEVSNPAIIRLKRN